MNRKRILRCQLRVPTNEDETPEEPGSTENRKEAAIGKSALMYFSLPLNGYCAGIIESYGGLKYGGSY